MSWVALVAATTLGISGVQRVRAAVSADPRELGESGDGYRLIVQSYAPSSIGSGPLPAGRARPLASTQLSITALELARGVAVDVLGLEAAGAPVSGVPIIVAWVERGRADLAFDGFEARPRADAFYGVAPSADPALAQPTPIVLKRHASFERPRRNGGSTALRVCRGRPAHPRTGGGCRYVRRYAATRYGSARIACSAVDSPR